MYYYCYFKEHLYRNGALHQLKPFFSWWMLHHGKNIWLVHLIAHIIGASHLEYCCVQTWHTELSCYELLFILYRVSGLSCVTTSESTGTVFHPSQRLTCWFYFSTGKKNIFTATGQHKSCKIMFLHIVQWSHPSWDGCFRILLPLNQVWSHNNLINCLWFNFILFWGLENDERKLVNLCLYR